MIKQQEHINDVQQLETLSHNILSDIIVYSKYAKYLHKQNHREKWEDIVLRNINMHINKFPHISDEIYSMYTYVLNKKVFPSMRMLQFSGLPIELSPTRGYNCSAVAVDSIYAFNETMFLLLGGTGVGVSVQQHHVDQLPELYKPKKRTRRYLISDNIEG
ncbi:MAG: hypothetical protein DRG78_15205 [Epsilonproteobacteria bacterium]|nr:MAG: hypothetical protein DRG78_15205 [Campylobacterota bacterium]